MTACDRLPVDRAHTVQIVSVQISPGQPSPMGIPPLHPFFISNQGNQYNLCMFDL